MLSYRHGFHAGNHADVAKHLVLLGLLQKMLAKDKPFTYIDSHSGAGLYDLDSEAARLNAEHLSGVVRLWQNRGSDPLLNLYLDKVSEFNSARALHHYPGSPALALGCLRPDDRMHLLELHPTEVETLRFNMGRDSRVSIHHRDAFEGLLALTPPEPRRGLVLIDPAFEDKEDYQRVLSVLLKLQKRWPVGIIALWYPMLARQRDRSAWLKAAVARENLPDALCVELTIQDQAEEFGMHGSGMMIINTPWQFREQMQATFAEVVSVLGADARFQIEALTTSASRA